MNRFNADRTEYNVEFFQNPGVYNWSISRYEFGSEKEQLKMRNLRLRTSSANKNALNRKELCFI